MEIMFPNAAQPAFTFPPLFIDFSFFVHRVRPGELQTRRTFKNLSGKKRILS